MSSTLYDILEVPPDATPDLIRKAYRKKARKLHPDAGGESLQFKELHRAYHILSDPARRQRYDETGDGSDQLPNQELSLITQVLTEMLGNLIQEIIRRGDTPKRHDLVDLLTKQLTKKKTDLEVSLREMTKIRDSFVEAARRFSRDGGDNLLSEITKHHADGISTRIQEAEKALNLIIRTTEVVQRHCYHKDPSPSTGCGDINAAGDGNLVFRIFGSEFRFHE